VLNFIRKYSSDRSFAWRGLALLIACNYLAFRVELFEDEYENNHPTIDPYSHEISYTPPTINWETFDKDNAPKAITIQPFLSLTNLFTLPGESLPRTVISLTQQIIRDKSPPR